MSVILLVRHAQATFGLGTYDKLSEQGQHQARHLGQVLGLRDVKVDRIVTGGLDRQRETAEILGGVLGGTAITVDPRWNEYDHLPLIARVKPMYRKQWMMMADLARSGNPNRRLQEILDQALVEWVADPDAPPQPDAVENFAAFSARSQAALDAVSSLSGTTVVISSAGTIAAATGPLAGVPSAGWPALHRVMVNGSVTKVVRGQRGISLISFNEHGHLEGVPDVKITYR